MCVTIPVSELVQYPINWVRGDDARLKSVFKSLLGEQQIDSPIKILVCGCGKTYMLEDGGHRITACHKLFKKTGRDIKIRVHFYQSKFM